MLDSGLQSCTGRDRHCYGDKALVWQLEISGTVSSKTTDMYCAGLMTDVAEGTRGLVVESENIMHLN